MSILQKDRVWSSFLNTKVYVIFFLFTLISVVINEMWQHDHLKEKTNMYREGKMARWSSLYETTRDTSFREALMLLVNRSSVQMENLVTKMSSTCCKQPQQEYWTQKLKLVKKSNKFKSYFLMIRSEDRLDKIFVYRKCYDIILWVCNGSK